MDTDRFWHYRNSLADLIASVESRHIQPYTQAEIDETIHLANGDALELKADIVCARFLCGYGETGHEPTDEQYWFGSAIQELRSEIHKHMSEAELLEWQRRLGRPLDCWYTPIP